MALDIKVVIDQKQAASGAGEWMPLIFTGFCPSEIPYTVCTGLSETLALLPAGGAAANAAALVFAQNAAPAQVAVYGATAGALDSLPTVWAEGWRQLIVATEAAEEEDSVRDIAAFVEAQGGKLYFASVRDLADITGADKAVTGFERTMCLYHPDDVRCPEAALVGASAGRPVGSFTYKNMVVKGISPAALTTAQLAAAEGAGCLCIVDKAGDTVTSEGKNAAGEYLDVLDARDYIVGEIETRTQRTLNQNPKVPYDTNGIALLENVCVNVLAEAFANGLVAVDGEGLPDYTVDYAPRSQTRAEDRAARRYVEGRFSFALAGAVHEATIHGVIEI